MTIFANGDAPDPEIYLPSETLFIAADGGARHCLNLGFKPQVVIGDFDSLTAVERNALEAAGVELIHHPTNKDETDLELALDYALNLGATEISLYGLVGGRWDMSLANILLLGAHRFGGIRFRILAKNTEMFILRGGDKLVLDHKVGDTVSVIPLSTQIEGLTYTGLEWPLVAATLPFGSPRGVSNRIVAASASIHLKNGIALVVMLPKE